MDEKKYKSVRNFIDKYCPYKHHCCDGRVLEKGGENLEMCEHYQNDKCQHPQRHQRQGR